MHLKILLFLCSLGGILAIKIRIGENQNLRVDLKKCLSIVMKKICPECSTGELVISGEPSWEVQALMNYFFDSSPAYAMMVHTMDRPRYEYPSVDQVGLYLANSEMELQMTLEHLKEANLKKKCVIWVNFFVSHSLESYLRNTTAVARNRRNARGVMFVALTEDDIQVFGTPIQTSGALSNASFRKLSICGTRAKIESSLLLPKIIRSRESVLTVAVSPALVPYIERRTANPGGYVGNFMNILKHRLHFTPKYVWFIKENNFPKFIQTDDPRMVLDLRANPKGVSHLLPSFLISEGVWAISKPNSVDEKNLLAELYTDDIFLHVALLAIYMSVMVYLSQDLDKIRIILRLFGMFFGIGVGWLPRQPLFRFLVVLWCFATYVLVQVYLAALTSQLATPNINEPFRDANDLMKSGIDVICADGIKEFYCSLQTKSSVHICEKCKDFNGDTMQRMLLNNSSETRPPYAITLDLQVYKSYLVSKSITLMQDRIGSWPAGVHSNMDSEFLKKMSDVSSRLSEAGILKYWLSQYHIKNVDQYEAGENTSNMAHFYGSFMILYVGWSCSTIIFISEILIKWYRNH